MKFNVLLLFLFLVCCTIEWSDARRSYSTGGSRSRGGYSSSSRSSYGSRPTSHSTSGSGSTSHSTSRGGSTSHSTSFGSSSSPSRSPGAASHPGSNSASPSSQSNKAATHTFLQAEGGGASRPASAPAGPFQSPGNSPYPASGPVNPFGTQHASSSPYQPGKPLPGSFSPSPHAPSAPPAEHVPKVTSATTQNQGAGFHNPSQPNPPWGNPHLGPSSTGPKPGPNPPYPTNGPYNPHFNSNPSQSPPYPVNAPYHPHPSSNTGSSPPYPVNAPYHPHPSSSAPYPGSHGSAGPFVGGSPSFGHPSYPTGAMPAPSPNWNSYSAPPLGNPYSTHYSGSAFHGPAQPQYAQPQILAQPAAQPFVPGQTVIMMPGQQDSGRGLGQIFKEALVFSTVNAAVNRVINPHHHYVTTSESRPAESSGSSAPTTHITYNNQYFNTYPNGTVEPVQPGAVPPMSPGSPPMSPGASPPFPGAGPIPVVPAANGAVANGIPVAGGSVPGAGGSVGTSVPGAPASGAVGNPQVQAAQGSQANVTAVPMLPQYRITDDDLYRISEELFAKQAFNLSKYVTVNLQKRADPQAVNITDEAPGPLFLVQPELLDYPSIYVTRNLYDNYEFDSAKKENRTIEIRKEENLLLDTFLDTSVVTRAMQWLVDQRFIDPDDFERKDTLRHVWFTVFDGTTSGFERVFAAEKYGNASILGVQDWLYFEDQEAKNRINYLGYVDQLKLSDTASLLKLNFEMDGVIRPNATIFVGTLPELEMSLYTICFYARPNNVCPVSLGGVKFNVFTHTFRYFGNDLIDLALPMF